MAGALILCLVCRRHAHLVAVVNGIWVRSSEMASEEMIGFRAMRWHEADRWITTEDRVLIYGSLGELSLPTRDAGVDPGLARFLDEWHLAWLKARQKGWEADFFQRYPNPHKFARHNANTPLGGASWRP